MKYEMKFSAESGTDDWVEVNLPWRTREWFDKPQKPSFMNHQCCRPGTEILVKRNGQDEPDRILIGHVNGLGGTCDDCCGIEDDDIVLSYRVLATYGEDN